MLLRIARQNVYLLLILALLSHAATAEFLIIPIPQKPKNVVTVAESGGQFTELRAALASITDASAQNPYVVFLLPGTYTVEGSPLQMKAHVSIIGSGRDVTFIVGQVSSSNISESHIISGADHAALQHLTIRNDGGGFYSRAIVNSDASPTLHDLDVFAFGGQVNHAIHNFGYSSPRISNVFAKAQFGAVAIAIRDTGYQGATIVDTRAVAEGATDWSIGIEVATTTVIRHTEASTIGGSERCRGLWLTSNNADIEYVTLLATGPDTCIGLWAGEADSPNPVRYSTISGSTAGIAGIQAILSTTSNYGLDGLQATCISSIDPNGTTLDASCRPIAMP